MAFCLDVVAEVMKEHKKWKGKNEDFFGMEDLVMREGHPRMADWPILADKFQPSWQGKKASPTNQAHS